LGCSDSYTEFRVRVRVRQQEQQQGQQQQGQPAKFDIKSLTFFLTYPQANDLTFEDIKNCIVDNDDNRFRQKPWKWIIGKENHEPTEGDENIGIHYHCFFVYKEKIRIQDARYFDIKGFHSNIQAARSQRKVAQYCTKHGDFMKSDNVDDLLAPKKPSWREISKRSMCPNDFMDQIHEHYTEKYFTHGPSIKTMAGERFKKPAERYLSPYPKESWRPTQAMMKWVNEEFVKRGRYSLV